MKITFHLSLHVMNSYSNKAAASVWCNTLTYVYQNCGIVTLEQKHNFFLR